MSNKIITCMDCGDKIDEREVFEYTKCDVCSHLQLIHGERIERKYYVCDDCWVSHFCNQTQDDLDDIRGEIQLDSWKEVR